MDAHTSAEVSRAKTAARQVGQHIVSAAADQTNGWDFRTATVTATSPLTVDFGDGTPITGLARLASYTPTITDVVLVLVKSPAATILGKFA
jgi:hypothetical protein